MTPSIEERREMAEMLRKSVPEGKFPRGDRGWSRLYLTLFGRYMHIQSATKTYLEVANRLADLIEPSPERTCRNTAGEPFAGYREFDCSECGAHLEVDGDTDANLLVGGERPMPNYCPNCGARVVER